MPCGIARCHLPPGRGDTEHDAREVLGTLGVGRTRPAARDRSRPPFRQHRHARIPRTRGQWSIASAAYRWRGQGGQSPWAPEFQVQNLQVVTIHNCLRCMGVLCTWMKLLTDLQISGCELHKNEFGVRTHWGSYSAPQPPTHSSIFARLIRMPNTHRHRPRYVRRLQERAAYTH